MIKIYNAVGEYGKVVLKKGIKFNNGRFETGHDGYGTIIAGRSDCEKADYVLTELALFKRSISEIALVDGFIKSNSTILYNPFSLEEIEACRESKNFPERILSEEAVLLFTDYVNIHFNNEEAKIKRIFGRYPETGAYLLKAGAKLEMSFPAYYDESKDQYEVLESSSRPKQLYLSKVDRKIKNKY